MSYQPEFKGWQNLSLADLLVAYRKVKADCFFENCFPTAVKFADFEQNLLGNLSDLLEKLKSNSGFGAEDSLLGPCRLLPKKLGLEPKMQNGHTHFSDPRRAFDHLRKNNKLIPEFRIVGDFPVDTHIVSALWINMVGHKFEACLDDRHVYGARLRRIRNDEVLDKKAAKRFHITAVGSFDPYFGPYKTWRSDGLKAIRSELDQGRPVIAVSLDLKSYYHFIDPSFIATDSFQREIGLEGQFSKEEQDFTQQLAQLLSKWSLKASEYANTLQGTKKITVNGGLTIGLSASRIVSNVLLHKWDRLIREKITPVHYGRYIDDMFLVLHDPGGDVIADTLTFMKYLETRLGRSDLGTKYIQSGKDELNDPWKIQLGDSYQGKSRIELQAGKQKLFILEGQAGCDLLDSIEKEISDLSSEHRLMPAPDQLEHTTAARVLSAAGNVGEEADTLRRADGLTIRRLSWSLQMRHVETLAHDLPPHEWKKQRDEFYEFAHNHVLRADKIFAHYQYLPRLLGFAISQKEWHQADTIVRKSLEGFDKLADHSEARVVINGVSCEADLSERWNIARLAKDALTWAFVDAAARYYPVDMLGDQNPANKVKKLASLFIKQLLDGLSTIDEFLDIPLDSDKFHIKAPLLARADLAKVPYKKLWDASFNRLPLPYSSKKIQVKIRSAFKETELIDLEDLKHFFKAARITAPSENKRHRSALGGITPFLFPTRPLTPSEIAEYAPACIGLVDSNRAPSQLWARFVRTLRGVWVNPALLGEGGAINCNADTSEKLSRRVVRLGTHQSKKVTVAISNLATEDDSWAAAACNKPDLTLSRYTRLSQLVNLAIKLTPRPQYLLLPELSLPLHWVDSMANRLQGSGINLIAGTEYRHTDKDTIHSEACLVLSDDRLGYPSSVRIWQPKLEPAVGEDKNLTQKFGKVWHTFNRKTLQKPVYNHYGFHFGVMVCSELQNTRDRIAFQGEVDALMVLAWNQDRETFSALIEACALDVHAYTVLVNNRKYGDSRVRAPAKKEFYRDIARLRGGNNDFCVTVELDIEKLREFQSRAKRWSDESDPFKPVPEGYVILPARKRLPPK
jgi:hypothetical protein